MIRPHDGVGAQVHDVQMIVNGQPSQMAPEVRRIADLVSLGKERRMISERLRLEDVPHLRRRQSWLPRTVGFGSLFGSRGGLFSNAEPVELDGKDALLGRRLRRIAVPLCRAARGRTYLPLGS